MLSTRISVLLWMTAIGLALAAAMPAGATVRSAPYTWAPATGPVAGYRLYISVDGDPEAFYGSVSQPSAVIQVDSGAWLVVSVAAFNAAGGVGPRSAASPPLRLCPGDFDGDELIESTDVTRAKSCILKPATGNCSGGDMNDDGTVTIDDYLSLAVGADACEDFPPLGGCRGDMNDDGWISMADLSAMKICIGLYAQGNCSKADFDGNGFVSTHDVVLAGQAIGTEACSN